MPFRLISVERTSSWTRAWGGTVLALGAAGLLLLVVAHPAAGQAVVQRTQVILTFEEISPHPVVSERLQATVQSVADRILLGRPLEGLVPLQAPLAETLGEVVTRVAAGYAIATVSIEAGVTSTVSVRLRPVGVIIRTVEVTTDLGAVHPKLHPLINTLLQGGPTQEIRALFEGLPVRALEWAESLLDASAQAVIEAAVVGYTATVRVAPGEALRMTLALAPRDARIIRNLSVRFRSASIPILLLDQHAPQIASMAEPLRGVPVTFARVHQKSLEQLLEADVAAYPPAQEYRVVASVALDVAETTYVTVVADSLTLRGRLEAQLNIGPHAPGPEIVIHLGRLVLPQTEAFVETHIVPNSLGLDWDLGGQLQVSPTTVVGASYRVVARTTSAFTRFQVGPDVALRGIWNLTDLAFEGGLNYRFNEFLAGEVVATSKGEVWLRLISNL